jgi:hypothetical protein
MAVYTYKTYQNTLLKTDVDTWLNSITGTGKRITSYIESPAVDPEDYITVKVLVETIA